MEGLLAPAAPLVAAAPVAVRQPLVSPAPRVSGTFPKDAPWAQRAAPLSEAALLAKYPHVIAGTRRYDEVARKWAVDIRCADCGAVRIVYTSDLFHVRQCRACKAKALAAKA